MQREGNRTLHIVTDAIGRNIVGDVDASSILGSKSFITVYNPLLYEEAITQDGRMSVGMRPIFFSTHVEEAPFRAVSWYQVNDARIRESYEKATLELRARQSGFVLASQVPSKNISLAR
jgi:hypothetical protein